MKTSYIIGAIALFLAGGTVAWGVHEYLSLKDQVSEIQKEAHSTSSTPSPTPSPSPSTGATTASVLPTSSPSPAPPPAPNFDSLPLCDQLDSIAKSGKKVYEFIVNSGQYEKFAAEIKAKCNWHAEQLKQAESILFPPVASEPPVPSYRDSQSEDSSKELDDNGDYRGWRRSPSAIGRVPIAPPPGIALGPSPSSPVRGTYTPYYGKPPAEEPQPRHPEQNGNDRYGHESRRQY